MINQNFTVVPQGLIESGTVSLQIDTATGEVGLQYDIKAGVLMFSKDVAGSQSLVLDPTLLLSQNIKPGLSMTVGGVYLTFSGVVPGVSASAAIKVMSSDVTANGNAQLDLSGQYIKILGLTMSGTADGEPVTVVLEPQ